MNETVLQITFALLVPIASALVFVIPRRRGNDGDASAPRRSWRIVLALAVPVILAFFALYGWPREQWQHTVFVPVVGAAIGLVMAATSRRWWWRVALYAVLGILSVAAVWPVLSRESMAWKIGPALATVLLAAGLDPLASRRTGPALPGALVVSLGTATAMVLLSGFMKLTIPMVALTIALGVGCALMVWRRWFTLADGPIAVIAPMLVMPPVVAWLYMVSAGEALPAASFILPALAGLAVWTGELPGVASRSRWVTVPVSWCAALVVCAAAVVLAVRSDSGESSDPMEEMYREMYGAARVVPADRS